MIDIDVIEECVLAPDSCGIDGEAHEVRTGAWCVYLPGPRLKLHHARGGLQHCLHRLARPHTQPRLGDRVRNAAAALFGPRKGRAGPAEWRAALAKPVTRRLAETWVVTRRLHAEDLGPAPLGLAVVRRFDAHYNSAPCVTGGMIVEDAHTLPPRPEVTLDDLLAAGVLPDHRLGSLRDQINGRVIDLNSVVGVMPRDADDEVARIETRLNEALQEHGRA